MNLAIKISSKILNKFKPPFSKIKTNFLKKYKKNVFFI